jgi:hypothetical protein
MSLAHITEYMAPTLANAVIARVLTCPAGTAHYLIRTLDASKAGRRNPVNSGALNSATRGRFFMSGRQSMAAGVGSLTAGRSQSPVSYPAPVRHPFAVGSERGGYSPYSGVTTMSHDSTPGASVATTPVRFVSRDTVIRRIRRSHARNGYTFHIARNQAEFDAVGDWSIRDRNGDIAFRRIANFESYARSNGSLKPDEMMVGQTLYRMFDAVGQLIGVQDSRFRADAVVKAINGSLVEFVVEKPEADDQPEADHE